MLRPHVGSLPALGACEGTGRGTFNAWWLHGTTAVGSLESELGEREPSAGGLRKPPLLDQLSPAQRHVPQTHKLRPQRKFARGFGKHLNK